jgi:hypothetical protein
MNNPTEEQTYRVALLRRLDQQDEALANIDAKVTFTNGKVRKIIIALVLISGVVIGQAFTGKELITSLIHLQ